MFQVEGTASAKAQRCNHAWGPVEPGASMAGGARSGGGGGAVVREVVGIQTSDLSRSACHLTCVFPGSLCPLYVEQYMGRRYQESS